MNLRPYLCGPIAGCSDSEASGWRDLAMIRWPLAINPMRRDYREPERDNEARMDAYREIVELDKRDIRECDVLLVCYDPAKRSVGTCMEIIYAWTIQKPVVLWIPADAPLSPWLRYHATAIVHTWEDAEAAVVRLGLV